MILVDSSVWINYFNGQTTWQTEMLDQLLQQVPVYTGDLILTEVLQGFRKDSDYAKAKEVLSILPCKELGGYPVAVAAAENYRALRKKGVTVRKTLDMIIGTFCIVNTLSLLHDDRDFEPMVTHLGLRAVSPAVLH
ncbi:MAG: PIN domain nuclease [Candidatus Electrothrix aestuarii]|uniref:PIN domain nuclease n=1 Tax=Candidatus Electrothrix aestuarii TaxID=3062594 RepID=A0AAU8LTD1_9BACT|nr:PIN domain nuclease [Candidatus Electrothrix aestuarii]